MIISKNTIKLGAIRQFVKALTKTPAAQVRLFSSAVRSSSAQIEVDPSVTRGSFRRITMTPDVRSPMMPELQPEVIQPVWDNSLTTPALTTPTHHHDNSCSHVVYKGPGHPLCFETGLPMPEILHPTDVIIKVLKTTICGTDLHILKGNVSSCEPGTRLGHEGIGEIVQVGSKVQKRRVGERVLVNTTTQCGVCDNCRIQFHGHCVDGGWQLGNTIDGMQGTHARVPHADFSTQIIPEAVWDTDIEDAIVMCSDILPTGLEVGLLDGAIKPGMSIAIVGVGPVGLASLITAGSYQPGELFVIDTNNHRLDTCVELKNTTDGLTTVPLHTIDNSAGTAVEEVMTLTHGHGVDLVVEAIGVPVGWYICQDIVKAGGHIAMLGVHGKSATINLERMWHRNFRFSAGLVHGYTIPSLVHKVLNEEIPAHKLISHKVPMSQISQAYDLFSNAARHKTLKVLLENDLN
ncbi:uncharacterized protein LOC134823418 [Bolinopsis microptera]|uniref:uncharacterized protein LOC134823418 n=1 Tax=Bolinopsis microptera TaxID=2820187 RepID=UPI00307A36E3